MSSYPRLIAAAKLRTLKVGTLLRYTLESPPVNLCNKHHSYTTAQLTVPSGATALVVYADYGNHFVLQHLPGGEWSRWSYCGGWEIVEEPDGEA